MNRKVLALSLSVCLLATCFVSCAGTGGGSGGGESVSMTADVSQEASSPRDTQTSDPADIETAVTTPAETCTETPTEAPTEPETQPQINQDEMERLQAMLSGAYEGRTLPIGGWATPASQLRTAYTGVEGSYDAPFALLAEAGLNFVITLEEWSSLYWSLDSLASAHRAGLKLWYNCAAQDADYCMERVNAMLASEHAEALGAIYVKDEPTIGQIEEVAVNTARIRELLGEESDMPVFSNLLPTYAGSTLVSSDYKNYLKTYIEATHPSLLMFDFYPYRNSTGDLLPAMLANIAMAQTAAQEAGIPLYTYIQSSSEASSLREPNLNELRANLHLNLAMGVKGVAYFLVCEHYEGWAFSSMINASGEPTEMYDKIQTVNAELAHFRGVSLAYEWQGVIVSNYKQVQRTFTQADCESLLLESFGSLTDVSTSGSGRAVVGCFADADGRPGYYVVNPGYSKPTEVTLHFGDTIHAAIWSSSGCTSAEETATLTLTLDAGEGVFIACFDVYQ